MPLFIPTYVRAAIWAQTRERVASRRHRAADTRHDGFEMPRGLRGHRADAGDPRRLHATVAPERGVRRTRFLLGAAVVAGGDGCDRHVRVEEPG